MYVRSVPVRILITILLLIPTLIACGGSANTPQAVAQRFADAVVREDYKAARGFFDPSMNESDVSNIIVQVRSAMVKDYGTLQNASARSPEPNSNPNEALVMINWDLDQADVANAWAMKETGSGWYIVGFWPVGQEVGVVQSNGTFATMTPAPTPQPTARDLYVQVNLPPTEPNRMPPTIAATITLVETGTQYSSTNAIFKEVPLGDYTIRLDIEGRESTETKVTIAGDQPLPNPILLNMGAPLPFDTSQSFFTTEVEPSGNVPSEFRINLLDSNGLIPQWSVVTYTRPVLDPSGMTLHFAGPQGTGKVDASGIISWDWKAPTKIRDWKYSPDASEIAYVENNDLWTLATTPDAVPVRWSQLGIFKNVIGWADIDTIVIQADRDVQAMQRNSTPYHVADSITFGAEVIRDRDGIMRMLQDDNQWFRFGSSALEPLPTDPAIIKNSKRYGWTYDNRFYVVHSYATTEGTTSGIFIVAADGTTRQVLPKLTGYVELFTQFIGTRGDPVFAPSSNQMALIWAAKEDTGIYVVDVEAGSAQRVSEIVPDMLLWASNDALLYVINDGADMGTWLQPLNGQPARKLFAYRAQQAGPTPDGGSLLIANETLWKIRGDSEPIILGEEGKFREQIFPSLIAPASISNETPATSVPANSSSAATLGPIAPNMAFAWQEADPETDSAGKPIRYSADQAIDGQLDTAWRVPGDGFNQSVSLTFDRAVHLSELQIVPGYAKVDPTSAVNHFRENRRIRRVRLEFSNKQSIEADLAEQPELQTITFAPVTTSYVNVVVLETTAPGEQNGQDYTAISEIVPIGQECLNGQCGATGDDMSALVREAGSPELGVEVEVLDGDYARITLLSQDRALDPLTAIYKRTNGAWAMLTGGTGFVDPASLSSLNIPESVWP